MTDVRDVLWQWRCRETCAEFGDPPCFEIKDGVKRGECHDCGKFTDSIIAALADAGLKVVGREPTEAMFEAFEDCARRDVPYVEYWRAMLDAA